MSGPTERPLRADARRNRDAILRAAAEAFDRDGINAPIDAIATAAGVGNATLYRNFPTREDLLAAVMQDSVQRVLREADSLQGSLGPVEALREWNVLLTWQLRIWQDLPDCIATAAGDAASPVRGVTADLTACTRAFLREAAAVGAVCPTVSAEALFELLTAISWAVDRFGDDPDQARARVDLATAGIFRTP